MFHHTFLTPKSSLFTVLLLRTGQTERNDVSALFRSYFIEPEVQIWQGRGDSVNRLASRMYGKNLMTLGGCSHRVYR